MRVLLGLYTLLVVAVWIRHTAGAGSLVVAVLITATWACCVAPRLIQARRRPREGLR